MRSFEWHVTAGPGYGLRILGPAENYPATLRVDVLENEINFTPLKPSMGDKYVRLWKVLYKDGFIDLEPADPLFDEDFYVVVFKGTTPNSITHVKRVKPWTTNT